MVIKNDSSRGGQSHCDFVPRCNMVELEARLGDHRISRNTKSFPGICEAESVSVMIMRCEM